MHQEKDFRIGTDIEHHAFGFEIKNPSRETKSAEDQLEAIKAIQGPEHEQRVDALASQLDSIFAANTQLENDRDHVRSGIKTDAKTGRSYYPRTVNFKLNQNTGEYLGRADQQDEVRGVAVSVTYNVDMLNQAAFDVSQVDPHGELSDEAKSVLVNAVKKWIESKN